MPSSPRQIISGQVYELEIRARSGLPFPALLVVRLLLASAMARAQRDMKVIISHFLWMGNHLHLLLVTRDAQQCVNFYAELMKKITDYFKRLLGLPSLELWEPGGPILSQVLDVDSAIDRIAYLYCNPARANLVESINEYPGFSSWEWFGSNPNAKELGENVPWIRQPSIPALGPRTLSRGQDRNLTANLRLKNSKYSHSLLIRPNAIYEAFDIHDEHEIALHNQELLRQIEMREKEFSDNRRRAGRHVAGSARLRDEPILKAHTPEKKATDRKVLFHTTSKQLALAFLEQFAEFRQKCLMAYRAWRSGNFFAQWPPGAFRPPLCPVANALA